MGVLKGNVTKSVQCYEKEGNVTRRFTMWYNLRVNNDGGCGVV